MWETRVRSLGWEDPLEKQMVTHSSTLAWKIPWTEEAGGLQSMGSQRVGHDWATSLHYFTSKSNVHLESLSPVTARRWAVGRWRVRKEVVREERQHGPELVTSSSQAVHSGVAIDHQLGLHVRLATEHLPGCPISSSATSQCCLFHRESVLYRHNHLLCILWGI